MNIGYIYYKNINKHSIPQKSSTVSFKANDIPKSDFDLIKFVSETRDLSVKDEQGNTFLHNLCKKK